MRQPRTRPRTGFTLVEMMVVVALTLFIMVILSTAFSTGLETFRQLKAVGDMQDQLRTAANMLRADLAADHFEGKRRPSDSVFWTVGPPREGFLRITQLSAPPTGPLPADARYEGADLDGLRSRRCTDHVLHFTVKRRGNRPGDFFSARVLDPSSPLLALPFPDGRFQDPGSNVFNSQWVEVIYFLAPALTVNGTQATANGTPLWGLYRQQRVVVPDPSALNDPANRIAVTTPQQVAAATVNYLYPFSCSLQPTGGQPQYVYFNSPAALTIPERRLNMQIDPVSKKPVYLPLLPRKDANGTPTGDDLVMTNVISFDVQVVRSDRPNLMSDLDRPDGTYFYDTWSFLQDELGADYSDPLIIPLPKFTVSGLQITLRVWDARTQQTRQVTIFQEM